MNTTARTSRAKLILCLLIAFMVAIAFTPDATYAATVKPSKVTITSAKSTSYNTVQLTWKKAKNAKKYQIYRATSKKGKYKKIKTTTSLSYKNSKLTTGKKYYYKVRAINGSKKGSFSSVKAVTPKLATPSVKASSTYNSTKITWSKVAGAKGYQVYLKTSKNGKYKKVKTTNAKTFSYKKSATTGQTHYYKVRAFRKVGKSYKYSSYKAKTVTAVLPKVKAAEVTASGSNNAATITWSKVTGAHGYQVYRSVNGGSYSKLTTTTSASYTDTSKKTEGATYSYKVRAYRKVGSSYKYGAFVSAGSITTKVTPPAAVKLTGQVSLSNDIELTWSASSGAEKYVVYRCKADGSYSQLTSTTATSYTDASAAEGVSYSYKVRAYKKGTYSGYSNAVTLKKDKIEVSEPSELQQPYELITGAESNNPNAPISKADGIPEHKDCYLDYDGDNVGDSERIYIGQRWTSELNAALNAQTGGSGVIDYTAERNSRDFTLTTDDGVTRKLKTYVYCYDTVDYDNFLLLYITGGKISGWNTNADIVGVWQDSITIKNGEPASDYELGIDWGLWVSTRAEAVTGDPNYAVGDVVMGGITYNSIGDGILTTSFRDEEKVAEYTINAFRATRGVHMLKHNETLYDPDANETTGYGTRAIAITCAMSYKISHWAEDLPEGPLANTNPGKRLGVDHPEELTRNYIIAKATSNKIVMGDENLLGGTSVDVGENVAWRWYISGGHKGTMLNPDTYITEMAVAGYSYKGFICWAYQAAEIW